MARKGSRRRVALGVGRAHAVRSARACPGTTKHSTVRCTPAFIVPGDTWAAPVDWRWEITWPLFPPWPAKGWPSMGNRAVHANVSFR